MDDATKINGIHNNSKKRIAKDAKSENVSLKKRIKLSLGKISYSTAMFIMKPWSLDQITKNPGLKHVSEDIFKLLDKKSLMHTRCVNSSWKNVLDQSIFWLNKFKCEQMSVDFQKSLKALAKQLELDQIAKASAKDWLQKFRLETLPFDFQNKWRNLAGELENDQIMKKFLLVLMKICQRDQLHSPLEIVVELQKSMKYPELINFILEHEDINSKIDFVVNDDEWKALTPIHLAACYGLTGTIEKLLVKYDSTNIQTDVDGDTPIICAAYYGHLETVRFLAGFTDLRTSDMHGQTPLIIAATNGHAEIVEYLSRFTENPNAPIANGITPLITAAAEGHAGIVKYLSNFTENPNAPIPSGITPLYIAAQEGHVEIVEHLSKFTENPNAPTPNGVTPLEVAISHGHAQIVEYLSKFI